MAEGWEQNPRPSAIGAARLDKILLYSVVCSCLIAPLFGLCIYIAGILGVKVLHKLLSHKYGSL